MAKVWVYPDRKYEEFGAKRFTAEWQMVKKGCENKDDIDPDFDMETFVRVFTTKEAALKFAQRKASSGNTAYGTVSVEEQVVDWFVEEDRIAEWRICGEPEYVDAALAATRLSVETNPTDQDREKPQE